VRRVPDPEPVRLDKWLWAARFFKTRALAVEAVTGGRVQVDGRRVKPGREVRVGDRIEITLAQSRIELVVAATARHRRPAPEAALLYEETDASREARELAAEQRRLAPPPAPDLGGRPTKRDRRRFDARRGRR
jgi:ribosome-associated heat shock protein Hsp15